MARLGWFNAFKDIAKNNLKLKASIFKKGEKYQLTLEDINTTREKKSDLYYQIFTEQDDSPLIKVSNTKGTQKLLDLNQEDQTLNTDIITQLSKDIYIAESYIILKDLLNLKN